MASFVLSFFPLDVLDEIWDLIESVSEVFLTYSFIFLHKHKNVLFISTHTVLKKRGRHLFSSKKQILV